MLTVLVYTKREHMARLGGTRQHVRLVNNVYAEQFQFASQVKRLFVGACILCGVQRSSLIVCLQVFCRQSFRTAGQYVLSNYGNRTLRSEADSCAQ